MQNEKVPRVDKNDTFIEVVDRKEAYQHGWIHRGVHAVVQNPEGKFFVPQRSTQKATWPGYFDLGLAETLQPDEGYEQALERGLQEELGIFSHTNKTVIRKQYYQEYFWEAYNIFVVLCLYSISIEAEPRFADGEVDSARWMSKDEVTALIEDESKLRSPWLIVDWRYYLGNSSQEK